MVIIARAQQTAYLSHLLGSVSIYGTILVLKYLLLRYNFDFYFSYDSLVIFTVIYTVLIVTGSETRISGST